MRKSWSKNLRKNTAKILGNQEEESPKKKYGENCWEDIQQKCYMVGTTRGSTRNIGDCWREIGKNRRGKGKSGWKGLTKKRKKKKLSKEK